MQPSFLPYDDIGITIGVLGIALAFIVLVWNAVKAIKEWRQMANKPLTHVQEQLNTIQPQIIPNLGVRLESIEKRLAEHDTKLAKDWEFQQDETEFNKLMLKAIKQLLAHEIDDNDKEGLVNMEKEIDDFLLRRAQ